MHNLERQREAEGSAAWQGLAKAKVISEWGVGQWEANRTKEAQGPQRREWGCHLMLFIL